jgi:predicted transcriptional regulator
VKSKAKESAGEKLLTETELELMTILWKIGEGSVADVMALLPEGRDLAYTSVSTILRILEQKKVIEARKEGRGHVYFPLVKKDDYESRTIKHVVEKVFDGTALDMVRQLLTTVDLSEDDLAELRKMVSARSSKGKGK